MTQISTWRPLKGLTAYFPGKDTFFFRLAGSTFNIGLVAHTGAESPDLVCLRIIPAQLLYHWMLGSQDHEGNAKCRIRTGSVNRQLSIDAGHVKAEFQTFTAPDPVFLHRLNAFRPAVQKFQIIQKFFRIIGNFEEPLFQIFFDDLMVTAPAASVDNLLISQNSVAFSTPVDSRFFLDGQTALIT